MQYKLENYPSLLPLSSVAVFKCTFKSLNKVLEHLQDDNNKVMVKDFQIVPIPKEYCNLVILNWCDGGLFSAYYSK